MRGGIVRHVGIVVEGDAALVSNQVTKRHSGLCRIELLKAWTCIVPLGVQLESTRQLSAGSSQLL